MLEVKHATYMQQLGWDLVALLEQELRDAGWARGELPLTIEAFESTVLQQLRERGIRGTFIYLLEAAGRPFDLFAAHGKAALTYRQTSRPAGLDGLVGKVDGISVDKRMILAPDKLGRMTGPSPVVADAHERGLRVFTWTCRPENAFLVGQYRRRRSPRRLRRLRGGMGRDPGCRRGRRLRRPRGSGRGVLPPLTAPRRRRRRRATTRRRWCRTAPCRTA